MWGKWSRRIRLRSVEYLERLHIYIFVVSNNDTVLSQHCHNIATILSNIFSRNLWLLDISDGSIRGSMPVREQTYIAVQRSDARLKGTTNN